MTCSVRVPAILLVLIFGCGCSQTDSAPNIPAAGGSSAGSGGSDAGSAGSTGGRDGSGGATAGGSGGDAGSSGSAGESAGGSGGVGSGGAAGAAGESGSGGAAGSGPTCSDNSNCDAEDYCVFSDGRCGTQRPGSCQLRPTACDKNLLETCGCDGEIYSNACEANAAGINIDVSGQCTPPDGKFGCGAHFCSSASDYCRLSIGDVPPPQDACEALPAECSAPTTCLCLKNAGLVCDPPGGCVEFNGGLEVSCPEP